MKQIALTSRKGVEVIQVPVPMIEPGQVVVAVAYSLISTGTEVGNISREGNSIFNQMLAQPEKVMKLVNYLKKQGIQKTIQKVQSQLDKSTPLGYSCSGIVIQVGTGVIDLKIGDRVACAGAGKANHAEWIIVPRNLVVRLPDPVSLRDAASTTVGAIALQGVRRADLRIGEWAAVIGLGLLGQITVQLLRAAGVKVVGTDLDPKRIEKALSMGMNYGIVVGESDVALNVFHITEGHGVDASILTAASDSDELVQQAMEITRKKGRVVVVGAVGLDLKRSPFYEKEIDFLISCSYGPGRYDSDYEEKGIDYPYAYVRWTENRNMGEYLQLLAAGSLRFEPLIEAVFPLEKVDEAYAVLHNPKAPIAVLLEYPESNLQFGMPLYHKVNLKITPAVKGKIRVALVGAGDFAQGVHLPNIKNLSDDYQLRAIVSRTGLQARKLGEQYDAAYVTTDYQEVLNDKDIDMVLICTRHHLHARQIAQAAEAGKSVFVEKPVAITLDELEMLKTTLQKTKTPFMVGFNRRFSPAIQRAKKILTEGPNPIMILYRVNAGYIPLNHWAFGPEGGGRIVGEACHMLDTLQYLVGSARIAKFSSVALTPQVEHVSASDNVSISVNYTNGSFATLFYTSLGAVEFPKEYIEIFCGGKVLVIDDFKSLKVHGSRNAGWKSATQDKGHLNELRAFSQYIRGASGAPISLDDIFETTRLSLMVEHNITG